LTPSDGSSQHWQSGDPLTEDDRALLAPLLSKAHELGRTPVRREVEGAGAIKRRFRTWGNAVRAAELPWVNYPGQRRLAEEARRRSGAARGHSRHAHQSPDKQRGDHAASQVTRHAEGATDHGGQADHETPAD
jgi:hypothetical protein